MNVRPASGAGTPTSGQPTPNPLHQTSQHERIARARILDDDIYRQEGRIRVLRVEMELQISMLKKKKQSASWSRCGARRAAVETR